MSNTPISNLPSTPALSGSELVPMVQNNTTVRATALQIAQLNIGPTGPPGGTGGVGPTGPTGAIGFIWSAVPGSTGASGTTGDTAHDSAYLYVCVGVDEWKRTSLDYWT